MRPRWSLTVIMVGLAAAAILVAGCGGEKPEQEAESPKDAPRAQYQPDASSGATLEISRVRAGESRGAHLPRLVDLGKGTCIPCKQMAPILDELKQTYRDKATVEIIDLRDDPAAAREYGIRLIPTQIFFDAEGREVWRHEGFLSRDAIVAKFAEMGVEPVDN
jgi:thioredoxin 1